MHIIKPTWLAHAEEKRKYEVYSCHVSPDGQRLATGGLDGTVRIWSTEAVYKAGDDKFKGPKQLCSMSTHTGAVLTVRWSGTNHYLASGSDDKIVLIYERDSNAAPSRPVFGSSEPGHTETWRTYRRLAGHDNDVQEVGWSHDSSILVSVGLDSKVIVWSGTTFERLKRLDVHQSHVKGLTFDPANKYFATASDDRSIRIFRFTSPGPNTNVHDQQANFVSEATITKPFETSPITTYFRRCSWSPDGSHIAAANATNGPVSSIAIIDRGNWNSEINLIGHEGPVEVCAFAPRMFSPEPFPPQSGSRQSALVTVIACAGQDKALSIWNTSNPRPLIILQDLATKTISDLAWSPEGRQLFVTSLDGSIVVITFEDGDLGFVVGLEENEKLLQKFGTARKGVGIPESVDYLRLEDKSKQEERREVEGRMGELMMDGGSGASVDTVMTGTPGNQWQMQVHGQGAVQQGQQQQQPPPAAAVAAASTPAESAATPSATAATETKPAEKKVVNQRVTITKDGRKRVTPMLVSSTSSSRASNLPNAQLLAKQVNAAGAGAGPQGTLDLSRPYEGLPKGGLPAVLLGNKRKHASLEDEPDADGRPPAPKKKGTAVVVAANGSSNEEEFVRPVLINASLAVSQVRLAVPRIRAKIARGLDLQGNYAAIQEKPDEQVAAATSSSSVSSSAEYVFEAKNSAVVPPDPTKLTLSRQSQVVWTDYVPRAVLLTTANQNMYVAACEDGSLHVFSPAGRRIMSPMVMEAAPSFLECRGWWLMCITAVGVARVWNVQTMKSKYPAGGVNLAPIFDIASMNLNLEKPVAKAESITDASITGNGSVLVCLTNGDGFVYSNDLCAWQRISEAWWAFGSQFWDTSGSYLSSPDNAGTSSGIIPFIERRTSAEVLLHGRGRVLQGTIKRLLPREGWEGFESIVSVAHLENRIAAAKELEAKDDFKTYLTMYARRIAMEGAKVKVEELCKQLASDIEDEGEETKEAELICGWSKVDLLKMCLLIFGKNRELQRITIPYARMLGIMDEDS